MFRYHGSGWSSNQTPICWPYPRDYVKSFTNKVRKLHGRKHVWYKLLDCAGNMHPAFPRMITIPNDTSYANFRHIVYDKNYTLLADIPLEDLRLYNDQRAYDAGMVVQPTVSVRRAHEEDCVVAVAVRHKGREPFKRPEPVFDTIEASNESAVKRIGAESSEFNLHAIDTTTPIPAWMAMMHPSASFRLSNALVARTYLSCIATTANKRYVFKCKNGLATAGDLFTAVRTGRWSVRMKADEESVETIPLPDLYSKEAWRVLQKLNAQTNRRLHCDILPQKDGRDVVVIGRLSRSEDSEILAATEEVMRDIATSTEWEIQLSHRLLDAGCEDN